MDEQLLALGKLHLQPLPMALPAQLVPRVVMVHCFSLLQYTSHLPWHTELPPEYVVIPTCATQPLAPLHVMDWPKPENAWPLPFHE